MDFEISLNGLFASPALYFGFVAAAFVLVALAWFRNMRRLKFGMIGGRIGYVLLRTELGHWEAKLAVAKGTSGDAESSGPAKALILGAIDATRAYAVYGHTARGREVVVPTRRIRQSTR